MEILWWIQVNVWILCMNHLRTLALIWIEVLILVVKVLMCQIEAEERYVFKSLSLSSNTFTGNDEKEILIQRCVRFDP